jgi:hypothetical protein
MRLALIGGVHPVQDKLGWIVVARDGSATLDLRQARLYPFTKAGEAAAVASSRQLRAGYGDSWVNFTARVVVEGDWDDPEDVTPVWVVEGLSEPLDVRAYFS